MVPEICSATEFFVILDRFLPFLPIYGPIKLKFWKNEKNAWRYYHFININDSHMMNGSSDMKCKGQNFCHLNCFCSFTPEQPEKSNFWKKEKTPRDIIILHMFTINDNHWIFCYFGPFFALTIQRIKILQKWKTHLEILSFYTSVL